MGIAGYSEMAKMLGFNNIADKYATIAKKMAVKWEEMANEGDHYRLAFDREDTWSQKYNMIWDKMWGLNLFPNSLMFLSHTFLLHLFKNFPNFYVFPLFNPALLPIRIPFGNASPVSEWIFHQFLNQIETQLTITSNPCTIISSELIFFHKGILRTNSFQ